MPIGLGLHFIIAIFFAVHAVRNGQERYWLFILFMFPILGSLVYAFAIWLPEARRSRGGQRLARSVRAKLDPGRELREAEQAFGYTATIDNRLRLASALVEAGRHGEAVRHYREALTGVHADDPHLHVGLARALFADGQAAQARDVLDTLIARHPDFRSPEGHLLYARATAASGDRARAREEFDVLVGYFPGLEARTHYAEALAGWGERDAARRVADEAMQHARQLPAYARRANAEWLARLRKLDDAPVAGTATTE